jgi:hypothetical protein
MLLDDYLPAFDVRASYATRIVAPPERAYACLRAADFDHWGATRVLYALRALPAFATSPGETWHRVRAELRPRRLTLDDLLAPAPPGTAKAAWNFAVSRRLDGGTELRTEIRVTYVDAATRRRFRAYSLLIRPAAGLIRREKLAAVRSAAESNRRDR